MIIFEATAGDPYMSHKAEPVLKTALADCTHEMSDKTSAASETSEASEASDDWLVAQQSRLGSTTGGTFSV